MINKSGHTIFIVYKKKQTQNYFKNDVHYQLTVISLLFEAYTV